jgi:hypothetical protein
VKELPTVSSDASGSDPAMPAAPQASSARLTATLAIAGAFAGLAIVLVFQWADPQILAH